jgi:integrase
MKVNEINDTAMALYARMEKDRYSQNVIEVTKWVIDHFERYCNDREIVSVDVPTMTRFLSEQYDIDYQYPKLRMQSQLRRPLLIMAEFYESGNYYKTHQRGSTTEIPLEFAAFFMSCREFVNGLGIGVKSKARKLQTITNYLVYLISIGVTNVKNIKINDSHRFLNSLDKYSPSTKRLVACTIRELYEWMYAGNMIGFSGRDAFPLIRKCPKSDIMSYYSKDEVLEMLKSIDTNTISGKTSYFIFSITAFLGIRAGDLVSLKFSDIDWANGSINIVQQKTGRPVNLPLIDEVKFPLLDYLKNARPPSDDKDYILISSCAPYTRYKCASPIWRVISRCVERAGLDDKGRHRGPHALRHSLATNLLNENVPLSAISNILGHSSTKTTEIYIGVDEKNLKELSLEVEDVL